MFDGLVYPLAFIALLFISFAILLFANKKSNYKMFKGNRLPITIFEGFIVLVVAFITIIINQDISSFYISICIIGAIASITFVALGLNTDKEEDAVSFIYGVIQGVFGLFGGIALLLASMKSNNTKSNSKNME